MTTWKPKKRKISKEDERTARKRRNRAKHARGIPLAERKRAAREDHRNYAALSDEKKAEQGAPVHQRYCSICAHDPAKHRRTARLVEAAHRRRHEAYDEAADTMSEREKLLRAPIDCRMCAR